MVWWTLRGKASKEGMKKRKKKNKWNKTYPWFPDKYNKNSPGGGERMTATWTD